MNRRIGAVVAGFALVAAATTGCGFGKKAPATVVVLPQPDGAATLTTSTRTVNLGVGQVLGVRVHFDDTSANWQQVSGGSGKLIKSDGEDIIKPCPKGMVGCDITKLERYKTLTAGTTTIEWQYRLGPGSAGATAPTEPCPMFGATARCAVGTVTMAVTIK